MEYLTTREAAQFLKITKQQIGYIAKSGKINFVKEKNRYLFTKKSLMNYKKNKFSRDHHFADDEVSAKQAAKIIGISLNQMYYLIYNGLVNYRRVGSLYIIKKVDLNLWTEAKDILFQSKLRVSAIRAIIGLKSIPGEEESKVS